ncbi:MAG: protein kinase [Deltaproteobacteria bacterium]|nr:MAG: protein kinase [Deltaproteobacteria bacterium]
MKLKEFIASEVDKFKESGLFQLIEPYYNDYNNYIIITLQIVVALVVIRIAWKIFRRFRPKSPEAMRVSKRSLAKSAHAYAKAKNYLHAGELYQTAGMLDDALDMYLKARAYSRAADVYLEKGQFQKASRMYEQSGDFSKAAVIYANRRKYSQAAEFYKKGGKYTLAGEMYEKDKDFTRAGECFEKGSFFQRAAEMFSEARDIQKAAALYEKAYWEEKSSIRGGEIIPKEKKKRMDNLAQKGGELYQKCGMMAKAVDLFSHGGFYKKAAEAALKGNDLKRAAELYLEGNEEAKAAEVYEKMGDTKQAAELRGRALKSEGDTLAAAQSFEQGEHFQEAAEIYRNLGNYLKAAEMYEKERDFIQAAEMFLKGKEPGSAASAYEKGKNYREAAEIYQRLGNYKKQSEMLERNGYLFEAGNNYYQHGYKDEAIKVLQEIKEDHQDFKKASSLLGDIFREKGELTVAIHKYKKSVQNEGVNKSNLRSYYNLAMILEQHGDLKIAEAIYNRILAEDYVFSDVADRLEKLKGRQTELREEAAKEEELPEAPLVEALPAEAPIVSTGKRYTLLEEIGRGGMGVIYKAKDNHLGRMVAYKMLPSDLKENELAVKNFLREARAAAVLTHPNIITVYDAGVEDGNYYIAMELVEGMTIRKILDRDGKLPVNVVILIAGQLCKALDYAHSHDIVHRDVKSSNIMWTEEKQVKIMDFGLAKVIQEVLNFQTIVGGTPNYMSPEQILGDELNHRTDIYSLGVSFFEMLCGELPFKKGDVGYHHIHTLPPEPRSINPEISEELNRIIMKCIEKKPDDRYQSTMEIFEDLKRITKT